MLEEHEISPDHGEVSFFFYGKATDNVSDFGKGILCLCRGERYCGEQQKACQQYSNSVFHVILESLFLR